jgi:hypothetical protein
MLAHPQRAMIALVAAADGRSRPLPVAPREKRAMANARWIPESFWRSQMSALAKRVLRVVAEAKEPDVLVHVRFHPNADVAMIGEKPDHLTPQQWYNRLCEGALSHYLALAGGRGFFRVPQSTFDAILAKA